MSLQLGLITHVCSWLDADLIMHTCCRTTPGQSEIQSALNTGAVDHVVRELISSLNTACSLVKLTSLCRRVKHLVTTLNTEF